MVELVDRYGRKIDYLRISITDRCNLKCIYCVPRDLVPRLSHDEIMTYEEILRLVRIGLRLGMAPFVVGILVIGVGTSVPELVSSIYAALAGETEIVVGNVLDNIKDMNFRLIFLSQVGYKG